MRAIEKLLLAALVVTGFAAAADPAPSVYTAARIAVAGGETVRTRMLGFSIENTPFSETPRAGAVLIGLDLAVGTHGSDRRDYVVAVRPVYRTASGETSYRSYGRFYTAPPAKGTARTVKVTDIVELRAKRGYAVGGMTVRSGLNLHGLSLTYHRIAGAALDPTSAYTSKWVGNRSGGGDATVSSNGAPVVGVFGNLADDRLIALGLIHVKQETPAEPLRPAVGRQPAAPLAADAPAGPPAAARAAAPAPVVPPVALPTTYHDGKYAFRVDLPPGWSEIAPQQIARVNEFVQQRMPGARVRYDAGFQLRGTPLGSYPYVLLQITPLPSTAVSYEEIERTLRQDTLKQPLKEVQGAFGDLVRDIEVGGAVLDRAGNRIVMRLQSDVPLRGRIESVNVVHLGKHVLVALHCYGEQAHFQHYLPTFTRMNDSFAFDDGHAFQPPEPVLAARGGAGWLPFAVFGGVSAAIFLPLMLYYSRRGRDIDRPRPGEAARRPRPSGPRPDDAAPGGGSEVPPHVTATSASTDICTAPAPQRPWAAPPRDCEAPRPADDRPLDLALPPRFFTVRGKASLWSGHRLFRLYVLEKELLVIDAGPGDGREWTAVWVGTGGLIGGLICSLVAAHLKEKTRRRQFDLNCASLDELRELAEWGKSNARLPLSEVVDAVIEAPTFWQGLGVQSCGWLRFRATGLGKRVFEFLDAREMRDAIDLLQARLGEQLDVNALFDMHSGKFVRRR